MPNAEPSKQAEFIITSLNAGLYPDASGVAEMIMTDANIGEYEVQATNGTDKSADVYVDGLNIKQMVDIAKACAVISTTLFFSVIEDYGGDEMDFEELQSLLPGISCVPRAFIEEYLQKWYMVAFRVATKPKVLERILEKRGANGPY